MWLLRGRGLGYCGRQSAMIERLINAGFEITRRVRFSVRRIQKFYRWRSRYNSVFSEVLRRVIFKRQEAQKLAEQMSH